MWKTCRRVARKFFGQALTSSRMGWLFSLTLTPLMFWQWWLRPTNREGSSVYLLQSLSRIMLGKALSYSLWYFIKQNAYLYAVNGNLINFFSFHNLKINTLIIVIPGWYIVFYLNVNSLWHLTLLIVSYNTNKKKL